MNFKEFYLTESKKESICYMMDLEDYQADKFQKLQKSLNIDAKEIVPKTKFHVTIRYMKTDKDPTPLIYWLKHQKLPHIKVKGVGYAKMNDAFVLKLESEELNKWFKKVNTWMIENGYPKSDFPTYKPHISFSYKTSDDFKIPEFKDEITLTLTKHRVSGSDYKQLWSD